MTTYHMVIEGTLGLTAFKFITDYLEREGLLPGFVEGYSKIHHDEPRHIGYGIWFLRETVRADPGLADNVRGTLRSLLPAVARVAVAAGRRRHGLGRSWRQRRGDPRFRAQWPIASAERSIGVPLETL